MKLHHLLVPAFLASLSAPLHADVVLPSIFSDHAVLQKTDKVPVWGKADPGEAVSVSLDGKKADTKAGEDGKWQLVLDLKDKGPGPYEMTVEGKNKISIKDVLVGEVWVCSGQSNMEWIINNTIGAKEEVAVSANPMLRQFLVKKNTSPTALENCEGAWTIAGPESTGTFTAVGYYFGKALQNDLKVPVGLLHTSWGGTPSEAWTSKAAIDGSELKATTDKQIEDFTTYPKRLEEYPAKFKAWSESNKRTDQPVADSAAFSAPGADTSSWKTVKLPGNFKDAGLPEAGAVWVRRSVEVPASNEGKDLTVELGPIREFESLYWNGEKLAEIKYDNEAPTNRRHVIPGAKVKAGPAIIALRVFSPAQGAAVGSFSSPFKAGPINLTGEWQGKTEFELPALEAAALAAYPPRPAKPAGMQNYGSFLFNAMIHPILPYAIKGAIWYQGESNAGRSFQYRSSFPLMIQDWRAQWKQGDFPFYFCQLANYQPKTEQPGESGWAELREAQTLTLAKPNTGMAVLIDIGETSDIHPRNKKDVGERLSRIALAKDYGKKVVYSGPVYESVKFEGGKAVLKFKEAAGGLVAKPLPETQVMKSISNETAPLVKPRPDSQVQGFAICGEDKQWKWADAKIEGDSVIVSSAEVPNPVAVRYAWANNPTCNLYNGEGLPASPFRSDDFPPTTLDKKY